MCPPPSFAAGVIDRDYRGNVGVVLFNLGKQEFHGRCGCVRLNHSSLNPFSEERRSHCTAGPRESVYTYC